MTIPLLRFKANAEAKIKPLASIPAIKSYLYLDANIDSSSIDALNARWFEINVEEIDLFLDVPEIAENGNQVKVSFDIDSPMTNDDFVKTVYLLADGNPAPNVAKFSFSTDIGACSATTRMRLSKTQNVYLLAEYNNGKFAMTKSKVKVTIGGCGG